MEMKKHTTRAIIFAFIVSVSPTQAIAAPENVNHEDIKPGYEARTRAYCTDVNAAKALSDIIKVDGISGYEATIKTENFPCYDSRFVPNMPKLISITLIEKMWEIVSKEGTSLVFWKVKDASGKIGYSWYPAPVNVIVPKTKPAIVKPKKGDRSA